MINNIQCVAFAHQMTKSMKSLGPKGMLCFKYGRIEKPVILHHFQSIKKLFDAKKYRMSFKTTIGFEQERFLLLKNNKQLGLCSIDNHKNTNHGKILKDILCDYDPARFCGIFISSDISILFKKKIDMNIKKNYIFYTEQKDFDSDITCNIEDNKVEYLFFETSGYLWAGCCFFCNDTIKIINKINKENNTDNIFLMELINKLISLNQEFIPNKLLKQNILQVKNNQLKKYSIKKKKKDIK